VSTFVDRIFYMALLQWAALLAFCLPLQRRPRFAWRTLGALGALFFLSPAELLSSFSMSGLRESLLTLALFLVQFLALGALVYFCVELEWPAALYCGIWVTLLEQTATELWWILKKLGGLETNLMEALLFGVVVCTVVRFTLARLMPNNGTYHIGPRQLSSAYLLGIMFAMMFAQMLTWRYAEANAPDLIRTVLLCQFYCVSLLYVQTELFKKSAMQKEMDALNLLYERQREQYQVARQNVQIINRKCHELKVRIADLRRLAPENVPAQTLDDAENAARIYDASANTGNEVLDVVLTEKALLCESHKIQMSAVADGSCLKRFEAGDLYALFANMLDHMIENAVRTPGDRPRMIDLQVCVRQNFTVIAVTGPERPAKPAPGHAADYEQKVILRIVQKYGGTLSTDTKNGFSSFKLLFPQKE